MEPEKGPSSSSQNSPEPHGLLRILSSVFSGFLFAIFLSKLKTPPQYSIDSISPNEKTSEESSHGKTFSPLSSQVPPTPAYPEYSCKCCHHKTPRWKIVLEVLMVIFTGGAFAAAAVYAGISFHQWHSQIEAMETEQRAWVTISDMPIEFETNSSWNVRIDFKNTGRTPAKNFTIKGAGDPVPKGSKPILNDQALPGHGVISPDSLFHSNVSISGQYDWSTTDLFIHGRIDYNSVFGHGHWTTFCYYFIPDPKAKPGRFAPCEIGNDVDSNLP